MLAVTTTAYAPAALYACCTTPPDAVSITPSPKSHVYSTLLPPVVAATNCLISLISPAVASTDSPSPATDSSAYTTYSADVPVFPFASAAVSVTLCRPTSLGTNSYSHSVVVRAAPSGALPAATRTASIVVAPDGPSTRTCTLCTPPPSRTVPLNTTVGVSTFTSISAAACVTVSTGATLSSVTVTTVGTLLRFPLASTA